MFVAYFFNMCNGNLPWRLKIGNSCKEKVATLGTLADRYSVVSIFVISNDTVWLLRHAKGLVYDNDKYILYGNHMR